MGSVVNVQLQDWLGWACLCGTHPRQCNAQSLPGAKGLPGPPGPVAMSSGAAGAVRLAAIVVTVVGAMVAILRWVDGPPRLHEDDELWIYEDPTPPSDDTVDGYPRSPPTSEMVPAFSL